MKKLSGILESSLGGFYTLRGYAKIGNLAKISSPDRDFQRELIPEHRDNIITFLKDSEFLFFPEIVLGVSLTSEESSSEYFENSNKFYRKIQNKEAFRSIKFPFFNVSYSKRKNILSIYIKDDSEKIFSRIDGNHRLTAVEEAMNRNPNTPIKELLCPFSIIIFEDKDKKNKFSRVIFNNINSKAIPITLEHNTKLIIEDDENYNDNKLKENPSFGWQYYFARKIYHKININYLPNLDKTLNNKTASGLLKIIKFLLDEKLIEENEDSITKIENSLSKINAIYENTYLNKSKSIGLLGAFMYYSLKDKNLLNSFKNWVIENNLTLLENISSESIIQIYNRILSSKKRTIFVSMPFRDETKDHYETMQRVVNEINAEFNLEEEIKLHRVDWFEDGTSYEITEKIFELIDNSGFLIADLTFGNPNVYHEVGYLMGRNKAQGKKSYSNFLLIVNTEKDKDKISFNLSGLKQIRFKNNEILGRKLRENIKKFYRLNK